MTRGIRAVRPPARRAGGLAYEVRGSGPPLVLVHGLASSREAWDLVVPDLATSFTTYAVDLPGHGDSPALPGSRSTPRAMAAALGRLLDELDLPSAHLVGNSLGGWTALEAAADGRALSVTALAPAGLWVPAQRRSRLLDANHRLAVLTRPVVPAVMRVAAVRRTAFAAGVERPESLPYPVAVDAALAQARASGYEAAHLGVLGERFDRGGDVSLDVPVTVVFGDRDRLLPRPGMQLRDLAPGHARWEVLWRCGHAPMWDRPSDVVRLVHETVAAAT
ncbi:MAG: alpha/beta fold hydrolase [Candidatus Nanopelagicales bacterium]